MIGDIKMFNVFGKLVDSATMSENSTSTIDIDKLSLRDGMYILTIVDENNNILTLSKVIVARK